MALRRLEVPVSSGERSPRTLDHHAWKLRSYFLPAWGLLEVANIGPDDVVALSQRVPEQRRGRLRRTMSEAGGRLRRPL